MASRIRVPHRIQHELERAESSVERRRVGQLIDRNFDELERPEIPPALFHWPGAVADHLTVRNGPWRFHTPGELYLVRYTWDTAPTTDATVSWYLDGSGTATYTHTVAAASGDEHTEDVSYDYTDEHIIGIATADGGGEGLSVYLYLR